MKRKLNSEVLVAVRQETVNGIKEFQILLNLGAVCLRFSYDEIQQMMATYKERFDNGETIYLPPPYYWSNENDT